MRASSSQAIRTPVALTTPDREMSALLPFAEYAATDATVRNPLNDARRIRAVLFDVDGTLYRQTPVRLRMTAELVAFAAAHPFRAATTWRALSAYRVAQESLRGQDDGGAARQLEVAASRTGLDRDSIAAIVDEWMIERPLQYLARYRADGVVALLEFLNARRVPMGVLSDYPALKKIEALGLQSYFSLVLCGGDPEIGAFKPNPRGFLAACDRWDIEPADVLYVGDRVDADAAGAAAARMPAVVMTATRLSDSAGALALSSFERLRHVLDDNDRR